MCSLSLNIELFSVLKRRSRETRGLYLRFYRKEYKFKEKWYLYLPSAVFIAQVLVGPSKQLKQIILIEHNRRSAKEKRILYIWYHKKYKFKRKVKEDVNTVRKYQSWRGFRFVSAFRNSTSFLFLKMYFRGTIWRGKKAKKKRKGQGSVCVEEKEKLVNNTLQILARKTCSLTHYSQPGFDEIILQIYCAFIIMIITE